MNKHCATCTSFVPDIKIPGWGECAELTRKWGAFPQVCRDHGTTCRHWKIKIPKCPTGRRLLNL